MITVTERARIMLQQERIRTGKQALGIQVSFLYGCGGAGFRVIFTDDPHAFHVVEEVEGIRIYLDAQSRKALDGAVFDWDDGPPAGFVLRHPDAAVVDFC